MADHIWPAQPEVDDTPTKAEEPVVAAPVAEESPVAAAPTASETDDEILHLTSTSAFTASEEVSATATPQAGVQVPLVANEIPPTNPVKPKPAVEFLMFMGDFIYADVPYYFGDTVQAYRRLYRRVYASLSFKKIYERLRESKMLLCLIAHLPICYSCL